jgi:hypothetical protein
VTSPSMSTAVKAISVSVRDKRKSVRRTRQNSFTKARSPWFPPTPHGPVLLFMVLVNSDVPDRTQSEDATEVAQDQPGSGLMPRTSSIVSPEG